MNIYLLLVGMWFSLYFILITFFATILTQKQIEEYRGLIHITTFFISTITTCFTGAFI